MRYSGIICEAEFNTENRREYSQSGWFSCVNQYR